MSNWVGMEENNEPPSNPLLLQSSDFYAHPLSTNATHGTNHQHVHSLRVESLQAHTCRLTGLTNYTNGQPPFPPPHNNWQTITSYYLCLCTSHQYSFNIWCAVTQNIGNEECVVSSNQVVPFSRCSVGRVVGGWWGPSQGILCLSPL